MHTNVDDGYIDNVWTVTVFVYAAVGAASWISEAIVWRQRAFQTVTNVAFGTIGVSMWILARSNSNVHISPAVLSFLPIAATLAAGSFAMHMCGYKGNFWAHKVDITSAWFAYVYLTLLCTYALAVQRKAPAKHMFYVLVLGYFGCTTVVLFFSDAVYAHQLVFFVVTGTALHAQSYVLRLRVLACAYEGVALVGRASLDILSVVGTQAISAVLQSGVLKSARNPFRNNIEHGYWHLGNAIVMTVVPMYVIEAANRPCIMPYQRYEILAQLSLWAFQIWLLVASFSNMSDESYVVVTVALQLGLLCVSAVCLWRLSS